MNIWEKFDKTVDLEGLKADVIAAESGKSEFATVTAGKYEVKVILMELGESKKGSPMLTIRFKILNGEFEGSLIFYNQVLTTGFGIHKANLMLESLGTGNVINLESFEQYHDLILAMFDEIENNLEFALDYSQNAKGYNEYNIVEIFEA